MGTLEVDIEDTVVTWAKKRKFLTPKVKFVEAGYPDRLFISPFGHTLFIEFKKPGEEPKPIQYHRLEELRRRGVPAIWCDSATEAIGVLKLCLETVVESSPVPEEGDKTSTRAGVSGALSRSGAGEDVNCASGVQDLKGEVACKEDANHRPEAPRIISVAGRDLEVVRLLRPSAYNPTWGPKGPKS